MRSSPLHYFPLALPLFLLLFLLVVFLIALIQIGILEYAYEKIGIRRRYVFSVLFLSLLGSFINIPVAELPAREIVSGKEVFYFGMRYVIRSCRRGCPLDGSTHRGFRNRRTNFRSTVCSCGEAPSCYLGKVVSPWPISPGVSGL
jgi:hypothetical protein